jgi:hypothetical protein
MYAVDASTGSLRWQVANNGSPDATPVVANGVVYISGGTLYARNAATGAVLWSYADSSTFSSPAVANGVVYVVSFDGKITALNATTGTFLWKFSASDGVISSPAVANGVVYFGSNNGKLYALNASNGALLWTYKTAGSGWTSSPTVVDGVVYIRAPDDNVYAFAPGSSTSGSADLFLRIRPTLTTVHQGDLLTYAFPVWNLGANNADLEVLNTQVPAGTTFDYIRISGTPGLGTCTHPPYQGTGQIVCHENSAMAPNTTWTVRLTVKVTAPSGTVITENAATMADTHDPNMANNTATVSIEVQ